MDSGAIVKTDRNVQKANWRIIRNTGIRVVDCGASLVAEDGHEEAYLIRAFESLAAHREQEERFYGSDAWRLGPRDAILSRIESYHTIVLEAPEETVQALQRRRTTTGTTAH